MLRTLALCLVVSSSALAQARADSRPAAKPAAPPAAAAPAAPAATAQAAPKGRFLVAPKLGVYVPTSALSAAPMLGVEVGYVTPALGDRLAVVLELDWARPRTSGQVSDPRLSNSPQPWALGNATVGLLLSAVYRLEDVIPGLSPYGGAGPGLYFHRAAMVAFGNQYLEKEGKLGFQVFAGADYAVGPGAVFLELRYHYAGIDLLSTGDANAGGFVLPGVGYRLRF
jgi:opacity protein-like surface antigen